MIKADIMRHCLWQNNLAERFLALMTFKQTFADTAITTFLTTWQKDVFDLRTCNNFGLSVWSVILGLPLYTVTGGSRPDYPAFGFAPPAGMVYQNYAKNFDNGNFGQTGDYSTTLTTEEKRQVLQLRAYSLMTSGNQTEINKFLAYLYPDKQMRLSDNLDMTVTYKIKSGSFKDNFIQALRDFGCLPTPAGVKQLFEFI